jgi:hypothetical protein
LRSYCAPIRSSIGRSSPRLPSSGLANAPDNSAWAGISWITGTDGKSAISYDDYAIALVDELETPHHIRKRFTIGY